MMFLLNDAILSLNAEELSPHVISRRFSQVAFSYVQILGQELYAMSPTVHRTNTDQAKKLASLIVAKAPEINAALFLSPGAGCRPEQVTVRFAQLDIQMLATLHNAHVAGSLDADAADREVWRRLAA